MPKQLSENNQLQLVYIEKLFDEKLLVVGEKLKNIDSKITALTEVIDGNNENSVINRVEKHEKWINEMTGKMAVISIIVGSIGAFVFSVVKDIFAKIK